MHHTLAEVVRMHNVMMDKLVQQIPIESCGHFKNACLANILFLFHFFTLLVAYRALNNFLFMDFHFQHLQL